MHSSLAFPHCCGTPADLPGSLAYLSARAAPSHPGPPCTHEGSLKMCAGTRLHPFREVGHDHLRNEAESGSLALRLAHSLSQASTPQLPTVIAGRLRAE